MRGRIVPQTTMLMPGAESLVPARHPIRALRRLCDGILLDLEPTFEAMYASTGRSSIPPGRLLKAQILIALYSIRSERLFCEQLGYNFLFRWFLDMNADEVPFDATSFSKNSERLLKHDVARRFFAATVAAARTRSLLSDDHFSVDGTMIEAYASLKSFRPKDRPEATEAPPEDTTAAPEAVAAAPSPTATGTPEPVHASSQAEGRRRDRNPEVQFRGQKRKNDTHASTTDPDSRLYRKSKGQTAKLAYLGHAMMENRNGLLTDFRITAATGTAERETAWAMIQDHKSAGFRITTLGADKGYDTKAFVAALRADGVIPHIAAKDYPGHTSTIPTEIRVSEGYAVSRTKRRRVEEIFGWSKQTGGLRRTRYRGLQRVQTHALWVGGTYNLLRMAKMGI